MIASVRIVAPVLRRGKRRSGERAMLGRMLLVPLLAFALLAGGEDLPRGEVIRAVTARANPKLSYALYLPSNYTPSKRWPILYCLDPLARGALPVERFAQAAEAEGFILAGSNQSRNGPIEPAREAIESMLADTHERLSIDDSRVYAAGFSGGARLALSWGVGGGLAGVVACGAGFGNRTPEQIPFALFAVAGIDDFNFNEIYPLSRELARRGVAHRFAEFIGGHDWLPPDRALEALRFLSGKLPPLAAPESKELEKQTSRFQRLAGEMREADEAARTRMIAELRRDAQLPEDQPKRRVARQLLGYAYVAGIERARTQAGEPK